MKAPRNNTSPIRTFSLGTEKADIYGAMPLTQERIVAAQREAQLEQAKHREEMASIRMFDQGLGSPGGGVGPLDPTLRNGIKQWEREQQTLFAPLKIGEIRSTSPIRTLSN